MGDATLYSYDKDNFTKFFFETKLKTITQLVRIEYFYENYIQENNLFRQQLFNDVRCANTPENNFKNIKYTNSDLVKHFVSFNNCTSSNVTIKANVNEGKAYSLKVFAGAYQAKIDIEDPNIYYNVETHIAKTIVRMGFEAEYTLPFYKNKLSIFAAPTYQKFSSNKSYQKNNGNVNGGAIINNIVNVDYSSVEIPMGARYFFYLNKNSKIHLNAAFVLDFPLTKDLEFTNTSSAYNALHSFELSPTSSFMGGSGYSYRRFSEELRSYFGKQLLSDETRWSAIYKSIGLNIVYKIL